LSALQNHNANLGAGRDQPAEYRDAGNVEVEAVPGLQEDALAAGSYDAGAGAAVFVAGVKEKRRAYRSPPPVLFLWRNNKESFSIPRTPPAPPY
jgi:hypothetical protein